MEPTINYPANWLGSGGAAEQPFGMGAGAKEPFRRVSDDELAESLLFYRRRLAEQLAVEMVRQFESSYVATRPSAVADVAADLAKALCERLEAMEELSRRRRSSDAEMQKIYAAAYAARVKTP